MKSLNSFIILATLVFTSFVSYAKPQITDIQFLDRIDGFKDLHETNVSQIALKFIRDNGSVRYTKGLAIGTVAWHRITVKSEQAEIRDGWIKVYRKNLIDNNYTITMNVKVYNGNQIFTKTISYQLPKIQEISIYQDKLIPYTKYPKFVILKTHKKTYTVTPNTNYAGFKYDDFKWTFTNTLISETYTDYTFRPQDDNNPNSISLKLTNEKLGFDTLHSFQIVPLEQFELSFNGRRGRRGESGSSGYDGNEGEDGGDGEDGYQGKAGEHGHNIELLIVKNQDQLSISVFARDSVTEYLLPLACKFTINTLGGKGGPGGYGGSGGSGGGEDADGNCGSSGSSGDDGPGGRGGNGGDVKIFSDLAILNLASIVNVNNECGSGGDGYSDGPNGKKGAVEYIILTSEEVANMKSALVD